MGGRLTAESLGTGRGARFTLELPERPPGAASPSETADDGALVADHDGGPR